MSSLDAHALDEGGSHAHLPQVSVVVPCRNEMASLPACLDALAAQTYPNVEILVVDGRSTDGCSEHARARGLRLLDDPGLGPAGARNVGIAEAHGELIAFTDADCVPEPTWIAELVKRFEDPTVGGVAGGLRLPRTSLLGRLEDNDAQVHYRGYITSNMAYRRSVLEEVGGFDPTLRCAEDYDLAWRVLDAGHRIVRAPEATVVHAPPELEGPLSDYLQKQFWYARHDIPTHVRALKRSWYSNGLTRGSSAALAGMGDAVGKSALVAAAAAGAILDAPWLVGAALGVALWNGAMHVTRTGEAIGAPSAERARMALTEAAKRLARGTGTIVGFADAARMGARVAFSRGVASLTPRAAAPRLAS